MSFSSIYMERDTKTTEFYNNINKVVDWVKIQTLINSPYTKGQTLKGEKPILLKPLLSLENALCA